MFWNVSSCTLVPVIATIIYYRNDTVLGQAHSYEPVICLAAGTICRATLIAN